MVRGVTFPKHMQGSADHNILSQLTNHSIFHISEGGGSSKQEINCIYNVKYVKIMCSTIQHESIF